MTERTNIPVIDRGGTLYFDGTCSFCRRGVGRLSVVLERLRVHPVPFADGASETEMIFIDPKGERWGGADAFLHLARQLPGWKLAAGILALPPFLQITRWAYRQIAKRRHCLGGSCPLPQSEVQSRAWLPLINLIATAFAAGVLFDLPGWIWMWLLCFAMWLGFKWQCYAESGGFAAIAPGYFFWPGMDPAPFHYLDPSRKTAIRDWLVYIFMAAGAALAVATGFIEDGVVKGWTGVAAMLCLLHFGLFAWLAAWWNRRGIPVQPIMREPWKSAGLGEFWGSRWNLAFSDWARRFVFRPLTRRWGSAFGVAAGFAASGVAHEFAISVPARGGYGLPTLYFILQGFGILIEKKWKLRNRPAFSRLFAWLVILLPAPLLFHAAFMKQVFNPMFEIITHLLWKTC